MRTLRECSLFESADDPVLRRLAADARVLAVPRGGMLFLQGDGSTELYVVSAGRIRLYRSSAEGAEQTLSVLTEGDVFGELSAVDGIARSATAAALTNSEVVQIKSESFIHCLNGSAGPAISMIRRLARMLRETDESLDLLAFADARARVISTLLKYRDASGKVSGFTHRDLAALASTARETVSRVIAELMDERVLRSDSSGEYLIIDARALEHS